MIYLATITYFETNNDKDTCYAIKNAMKSLFILLFYPIIVKFYEKLIASILTEIYFTYHQK